MYEIHCDMQIILLVSLNWILSQTVTWMIHSDLSLIISAQIISVRYWELRNFSNDSCTLSVLNLMFRAKSSIALHSSRNRWRSSSPSNVRLPPRIGSIAIFRPNSLLNVATKFLALILSLKKKKWKLFELWRNQTNMNLVKTPPWNGTYLLYTFISNAWPEFSLSDFVSFRRRISVPFQ